MLALASLGCSVAVHYNTAADTAEEVVKQLEVTDVKVKAFQANLGDYDHVRAEAASTNKRVALTRLGGLGFAKASFLGRRSLHARIDTMACRSIYEKVYYSKWCRTRIDRRHKDAAWG